MWQVQVNYCASHVLVQSTFRRYYFYSLPDQAQILLDHFNVLDELLDEIPTGFDNRLRNSSQTLIVNICHFRQRYKVAESGQILQWGLWGNSLPVVGFERFKNNIAENSFALGDETHNT